MDWAWKLGRIAGIAIKIHFTFPLVVLWLAFQLGATTHAGMAGYLYGAVLALLLFGCVLLHELGHSLTAIHYGIKVRDITLTPIGGVAQLTRMPDLPRQELAITAAGPAVNFLIAALLLPLAIVIAGLSGAGGWRQFLQSSYGIGWGSLIAFLFTTNIMLGLFNLLPAFPMDGGRILRATLSLWLGQIRATNIAVAVGQVIAVGLGLFGLLTGSISMILIAGFIFFAGAAENRAMGAQQILGRLNAGQALLPTYVEMQPGYPLHMVMDYALRYGLTHFPVMQNGQLIGVLTRERMLDALQKYGPYVPVDQIMQTDFTFADAGEPLLSVQQRMAQTGSSTAGVFQNGRLLGLLTPTSMQYAYNRLIGLRPEWAR